MTWDEKEPNRKTQIYNEDWPYIYVHANHNLDDWRSKNIKHCLEYHNQDLEKAIKGIGSVVARIRRYKSAKAKIQYNQSPSWAWII